MASGSDPLADMQNMIGYAGLVGQNPYLQYQGKIPMAGFYTGNAGNMPPTDATGQPIQSFVNANNSAQPTQGTTLNSTPNSSIYGSSNPDLSKGIYSAMPQGGYNLPAGQGIPLSQFGGPNAGGNQNQQAAAGMAALMGLDPSRLNGMPQQQPQQPQQGGGQPPSPPDMRQAYLNALSNPGPLRTYGAAPPQAGQALTGSVTQPNVMQQFLANNQGRSIPGGYSNQGIFNSLKQQQGVA